VVAELGPEAPPVGNVLISPPARLPGTDTVVLVDLSLIASNRARAIAAAKRISGAKWRS
jgi:hypothetical protein